jgi:uncharacterized protein (TIGR02147 family)
VGLFDSKNYKDFLRKRLKAMPKEGHGQVTHIARVLRMHPTRLSQILNGHVNLTLEQAGKLAHHLGLTTLETECFLSMVQYERAGTEELRVIFRAQITRFKEQSKELKYRVPKDVALTENQKAVFYSSWAYSAVRLACSVKELQSLDALAGHFDKSRNQMRAILEFLLESGLIVERSGHFEMGPKTTHLEKSSPLALRHHSNWRLKAISRHERLTDSEIAYTCPVSIRREDQAVIREMVMQLIERFLKKVVESDPPDSLACLNIDWFNVER